MVGISFAVPMPWIQGPGKKISIFKCLNVKLLCGPSMIEQPGTLRSGFWWVPGFFIDTNS